MPDDSPLPLSTVTATAPAVEPARSPVPASASLASASLASAASDMSRAPDISGAAGWLGPVLAPVRPVFGELLLISLFLTLLALTVPLFIQQVYDRVVAHAGMSTLQGLMIGMGIVLACDFVLRQARSRTMHRVALRIDALVGQRLFNTLLALPLATLESRPAAHWQRLFQDVDIVRDTLAGATAVLAADLPFVVLFVAMVWLVAPPLAVVFALLALAFLILALWSGHDLDRATRRERQMQALRDTLITECAAGRGTIKALGLGHALFPLWENRQAEAMELSLARGARGDRYVNIGTLLTVFATVTLTAVGAIFVIHQDISVGALVAVNMLAGRMFAPIYQLVSAWRAVARFRQSLARLNALFALPVEPQTVVVQMARPRGVLVAEQIRFTYDPQAAQPVLDGISFRIAPGGAVAIIGPNGCGKSTLLKLLLGLYTPDRGRVLLDGGDIRQFTRDQMAGWVGYVPQECVLFSGSIRDNIAHGMAGASDAAILRAARLAGVHERILELPGGYGARIGEGGAQLSAGIRQRLAIARALVGDPPVLLLDEPSASLDRQAESDLAAVLAELSRDHAIAVVSHSPTLLAACRRAVVLERGRVVADQPVTVRNVASAAPAPAPAAPPACGAGDAS